MNKDGKFKLGNEMWKVNWHERGIKKKFESPTAIEAMTATGSILVGDSDFFFVLTLLSCW